LTDLIFTQELELVVAVGVKETYAVNVGARGTVLALWREAVCAKRALFAGDSIPHNLVKEA
jgi:hypothetical protein